MEQDEETGLAYHSARYYASWLGRWSSSDPMKLKAGVNSYRYSDGDPIANADPNGQKPLIERISEYPAQSSDPPEPIPSRKDYETLESDLAALVLLYEESLRSDRALEGEIIKISGHKGISQIQVHPGGGRHGGAYYKISTTTEGKIKVVDPKTYTPTPDKKVRIVHFEEG